MRPVRKLHAIRSRPALRFTLWHLFVFVTLASVSTALVKWNWQAGGFVALSLWCMWGTGAAMSLHMGRTASVVAAFGCGLVWYLAAWAPASTSGNDLSLLHAVYCCVASAISGSLARLWDKGNESRLPWLLSAAMVYLNATLFVVLDVAVHSLKLALRDFGGLIMQGAWTLSNSRMMFGRGGWASIG